MKKLFLFSSVLLLALTAVAQKGKSKNNKTETPAETAKKVILGEDKKKASNKSVDVIWEGTSDDDGGGPKPAKNQPAKVRAAFASDYPNAKNVSWSKYRGQWTARFSNGLTTSTAVYHANGQRKDTRTVIDKPQLPKTILDNILKKPGIQLSDIIKIEVAGGLKDLFRIKTVELDTPRFVFYDASGKEVNYSY